MSPREAMMLAAALLVAGCTAVATGQASAEPATVGNLHYAPPDGFAKAEDGPESGRVALWTATGDRPSVVVATATAIERNSSPDAVLDNLAQGWDPRIYLSVIPAARWSGTDVTETRIGSSRWVTMNATALTGADGLDNASISIYGTADTQYIYAIALITPRGGLGTWYPAFQGTLQNVTLN